MRLAVISDVHGNLPALRAALRALGDQGIDRYLCAGDLVGYGPFPNECVEAIAELDPLCVAGNHDLVAVDRLSLDRCGPLGRVTLRWTRQELTPGSRAYLESLPATVELDHLVMAHGSLADAQTYVESEDAGAELARLRADRPDARLLVLGHTHSALAYGEESGELLRRRAGLVALPEGERHLINPGSIGQARERRAFVRFLVLDTDARSAEFQAIDYDHGAVRRALRERGLPEDAAHRKPRARAVMARPLRRVARALLPRSVRDRLRGRAP